MKRLASSSVKEEFTLTHSLRVQLIVMRKSGKQQLVTDDGCHGQLASSLVCNLEPSSRMVQGRSSCVSGPNQENPSEAVQRLISLSLLNWQHESSYLLNPLNVSKEI